MDKVAAWEGGLYRIIALPSSLPKVPQAPPQISRNFWSKSWQPSPRAQEILMSESEHQPAFPSQLECRLYNSQWAGGQLGASAACQPKSRNRSQFSARVRSRMGEYFQLRFNMEGPLPVMIRVKRSGELTGMLICGKSYDFFQLYYNCTNYWLDVDHSE